MHDKMEIKGFRKQSAESVKPPEWEYESLSRIYKSRNVNQGN